MGKKQKRQKQDPDDDRLSSGSEHSVFAPNDTSGSDAVLCSTPELAPPGSEFCRGPQADPDLSAGRAEGGSEVGSAAVGPSGSAIKSDAKPSNKRKRGSKRQCMVIGLQGQITNFNQEGLLRFVGALNLRIITCGRTKPADPPPRVVNMVLWRRHLLVEAADEPSKEWIRRELINIRPWGLANLVELDLGRVCLTTGILRIPHFGEPLPTKDIMQFIEKQNDISCALWKVWTRLDEPWCLLLKVGIDQESVAIIKREGYRLFCLGSRIQVYFIKGCGDECPREFKSSELEEVSFEGVGAGDSASEVVASDGDRKEGDEVVIVSESAEEMV